MPTNTPPSTDKIGLRFAAELIGTYLLVTMLIAAYFITLVSSGNPLVYALVYAVTLTLLITVLQRWSYQFNPIVSLVIFITRGQNLKNFLVAVLGQLVGATLGALTVVGLINLVPGIEAGVPALDSSGVSMTLATTMEGFGILWLLLIYVWHTQNKENQWFPILAGLSVIPGSLLTLFISGAALNPVRILGAAILQGGDVWKNQWIYWVGPLIAALLVIIVSGLLLRLEQRR